MSEKSSKTGSATLDAISGNTETIRANALQTEFYSKVIKRLRIILPLIAIGIITIVFTWDVMDDYQQNPEALGTDISDNVKNELINPRYEGVDEKSRPFTITADIARQSNEQDEFIQLDNPKAQLDLEESSWIALEAKNGLYHQKDQTLMLSDHVMLYNKDGYRLNASILEIDVKQGLAVSDSHVTAEGPAGHLEATGLRGNLQENRLFFSGPARLILNEDPT